MFVTLSFSNTSRARSCRFARATSASVDARSCARARSLRRAAASSAAERHAVDRGERQGVEKRLARRQQRAGHHRREPALDQRRVEPRLPLRRRAAETRPEVHALGAGQHRVEHQHREEVGVGRRRRVPRDLQVRRSSLRARCSDAPLADLRRLGGARAAPAAASAAMRAEVLFRARAAPRRHRRRRRRPAWRCSGM